MIERPPSGSDFTERGRSFLTNDADSHTSANAFSPRCWMVTASCPQSFSNASADGSFAFFPRLSVFLSASAISRSRSVRMPSYLPERNAFSVRGLSPDPSSGLRGPRKCGESEMQRQTLSATGLSAFESQTVRSIGANLAAQTILPDFARPSGFPSARRPAAGRHFSNALTTSFHSPFSGSYGRNHEPPDFVMASARAFAFPAVSPLNAHPKAETNMAATDGYPAFIAFSAR